MGAGLLACAVCACTIVLSALPSSSAQPSGCENRVNDTPAKLDACITPSSLWGMLSQFQRIADQNKGPDGHGYRDSGTPGYEASVDYVAGRMQRAGYNVTIQQYVFASSEVSGTPQFGTTSHSYGLNSAWFVALRSGSGAVTAPVEAPSRSGDGCFATDFGGFTRGNIALIERGQCTADTQVANARAAGARAVILYLAEGAAYRPRLNYPAGIPVIGVAMGAVGADLTRRSESGSAVTAHIDVQMRRRSITDYNLIAESPYGDAAHTVVIDAHLDSIYGAGMLDNASGSTSILATALALAKTPTHNRLRYIWFGGEELGLNGSSYYTTHLTPAELHRIAFDVDVDVTATPNFDLEVADPAYAQNVGQFPSNVVPQSRIGNDAFYDFFTVEGVASRPAPFGNSGTDSNSFALVGVPDSGILTRQDCCKGQSEVRLWGGFTGNYEGHIPSFDGGCVDLPNLWCDNLSNNDPFVLELATKAVAKVTLTLANDAGLRR
jgi:Zn-dependent M28 family amino/carboxypeptidase